MGKTKKQSTREAAVPAARTDAAAADAPENAPPEAAAAPRTPRRLRRLLPDLVKVGLALAGIVLGGAIWLKPPLIRTSYPYVTYCFEGRTHRDALLFRPLAMPTRYYIQLPRQLGGRYTWFAVDRRREVAALAEAPSHLFWGQRAVKRSDPLGLDLEFRKLDGSEWQVHFFDDAIVFSNAVLLVSMDTKQTNSISGK